jgi:hypothetical protein
MREWKRRWRRYARWTDLQAHGCLAVWATAMAGGRSRNRGARATFVVRAPRRRCHVGVVAGLEGASGCLCAAVSPSTAMASNQCDSDVKYCGEKIDLLSSSQFSDRL